MYDVLLYRRDIQAIGGIETWLLNLARRYGKSHKMAIVYADASYETLRELAKYVEIIKYEGQDLEARTAVFCYDFLGLKTCKAKEKVHVIHADHSKLSFHLTVPEGIDRVVSVSEAARQGFLKVGNRDSDVVYNPVDTSHRPRVLRLVSGTRLTSEKGLDRMKLLAAALDRIGALYEWQIFTNEPNVKSFSPNVILRPSTRHLLSYVERADYLVQLSDTESYGYSVVEALEIGTPVVVTDLPVFKEIGITEDHGVIIPLDATDYTQYARDVEQNMYSFEYSPPKDGWDSVFKTGTGNDYKYKPIIVESVYPQKLTLMEEGVDVFKGDRIAVLTRRRAEILQKGGYVQIVS